MDRSVGDFSRLVQGDPRQAARALASALPAGDLESLLRALLCCHVERNDRAPTGWSWGGEARVETVRGAEVEILTYTVSMEGRRPWVKGDDPNPLMALLARMRAGERFDIVGVRDGDTSPSRTRYCAVRSHTATDAETACGESVLLVHEPEWERVEVKQNSEVVPTCPACVLKLVETAAG